MEYCLILQTPRFLPILVIENHLFWIENHRLGCSGGDPANEVLVGSWQWREGRLLTYELLFGELIAQHLKYMQAGQNGADQGSILRQFRSMQENSPGDGRSAFCSVLSFVLSEATRCGTHTQFEVGLTFVACKRFNPLRFLCAFSYAAWRNKWSNR
jgi:hypothetical protein